MRGAGPIACAVEGAGEHAVGEDAPVLALEQLAEEEKVACHLCVGGWHDAVVVFLFLGRRAFRLACFETKTCLVQHHKNQRWPLHRARARLGIPLVKRGLVHVEACAMVLP